MKKLKLHIKDMVCPRCETVIRLEMERLAATVVTIKPGYAIVEVPPSVDVDLIGKQLRHHGFELLEDPEHQLVERIRTVILEYLYHQEAAAADGQKVPILSQFLTHTIGRNYSHLSKLFSRYEGKTLEQHYIHLKIERVKEFLDYGELNAGEIADKLGYSSVHYLSAQFKKVTNTSMTKYRKESERIGRNYFNQPTNGPRYPPS